MTDFAMIRRLSNVRAKSCTGLHSWKIPSWVNSFDVTQSGAAAVICAQGSGLIFLIQDIPIHCIFSKLALGSDTQNTWFPISTYLSYLSRLQILEQVEIARATDI